MQALQKYYIDFFSRSALCSIHIFQRKLGYTRTHFALITFRVMSVSKGTQHAHNRSSNMCITWTQNMFKYHKVKINEVNGRLGEKIATIILYAFNVFGCFPIQGHKVDRLLVTWGRLEIFFLFQPRLLVWTDVVRVIKFYTYLVDSYKYFFNCFLQRRICIPKKIQFTIIDSYTFIFLKIPLPVRYMWVSNFKTWRICIKDMHIKISILSLNEKNFTIVAWLSRTKATWTNSKKIKVTCEGIEPQFLKTLLKCNRSSLPHPHPTQNKTPT